MKIRTITFIIILVLTIALIGCAGNQSPIKGLDNDLYIQGSSLIEDIMSEKTRAEIEKLAENGDENFAEIYEEFDKVYELYLPSSPSDEDKVYKKIIEKICIMKRTIIASEKQMKDMGWDFPLVKQQNDEQNIIIKTALADIESATNIEDLNDIYDTMKNIE